MRRPHPLTRVLRAAVAMTALVLTMTATATATTDPAALTQAPPPDYSGLRVDRAWVSVDTAKTIGRSSAWSNVPIPDTVGLDPLSATVAAEVQAAARANGSNTWINRTAYTPQIYTIPPGQPLHRVRLCRGYNASTHACDGTENTWGWDLKMMLAGRSANGSQDLGGGVPIPDGATGAPGTDSEIVVYQPDWKPTATSAALGRVYELWGFKQNPDFDATLPEGPSNAMYMVSAGTRVAGLNQSYNHSAYWTNPSVYYQADQPGYPNSQGQNGSWAVMGSGLHFISDIVTSEDCALGRIDHAVGLELPWTKYAIRWPATKSDGLTNTTLHVTEGMRLKIPASIAKPAGMTRFENDWWDAAVKYGAVVDDQTGSAVVSRVQLGSLQCLDLFDGQTPAQQLDQIPFSQMVVVSAAGASDSNPNPTG